MSNNKFGLPGILSFEPGTEAPDPTFDVGGSAQSSTNPCSYIYWLHNYGVNLDNDPEINEDDYYIWWIQRGFNQAQWEEANPTLPWPGGSNP